MRANEYKVKYFEKRYQKTKVFLKLLCSFILTLTTNFYYNKLYKYNTNYETNQLKYLEYLKFNEYFGEE